MRTLEVADHLLLGRRFDVSVWLTGVASALFVVTFLLRLLAVFGPLPVASEGLDGVALGLALVVAAAAAYYNDGLLVSVALAASLSMGFYLPHAFALLTRPHESALLALGLGVGYALLLGAAGFLVGAGARRALAEVRG
ncbi:MAG: hypothetical protein ABEJ74_02420 [Haloferacaceae archaeon]